MFTHVLGPVQVQADAQTLSLQTEMAKVASSYEDEKRSRVMLAEHLEEANMNVSKLAGLIRTAENVKIELKSECERLTIVVQDRKLDNQREVREREEQTKRLEEAVEKLKTSESQLEQSKGDINAMKMEKQRLELRADGLEERIVEKEKRMEHLEGQVEKGQESYLKSREDAVERERGEVEVLGGWQRKMDEAVSAKDDELKHLREEARNFQVEAERRSGEVAKLEESLKTLTELIDELKRGNSEKYDALNKLEANVGTAQTEDEKLRHIVTQKQRAIVSVQRLVDRKLVPLKHDLKNLKVQVGTELESFGKEVYQIVKDVHEKWGQTNKIKTRRLSQNFDKELFSLKENYEKTKVENTSEGIRAEVEKREQLVTEKDDEIRVLNDELKELRDTLQVSLSATHTPRRCEPR